MFSTPLTPTDMFGFIVYTGTQCTATRHGFIKSKLVAKSR